MDAIERYLHADGLVRRGNGLLALIDGDACGFIAQLPKDPAPTAIGVSEPTPLSAMAPAFRQASRALETALALGAKGIFGFGDLGIQPAITTDAEVGEALVRRYVDAVLAYPSGPAILTTVERYLANDRAVDVTAQDLAVHPNTVRQRLERFEESTGRSLRETEPSSRSGGRCSGAGRSVVSSALTGNGDREITKRVATRQEPTQPARARHMTAAR